MSDITTRNSAERLHSGDQSRNLSLRRHQLIAENNYGLVTPTRPIVVVLGMHRSGTSLLSNVLHVLGVDMADTTDRVNEKNAGGYWERPEMFRLQDEILAALGRPIGVPSHVLPFPAAWWRRKEVQALKPKLMAYLNDQLSRSTNPWGFKDPRTCRLLPLWWEVFRELNVEPIYIHAIRAPAEAAVSMSQQSSARRISAATGELMWLSYNYDIARHVTLKGQALRVDYSEWFDDANAVARRLCEQLGIGQDLEPDELAECLSTIVQPDYRRQFANVTAGGSIAGLLYKSLTAENARSDDALRALRGQLRLVDMFFKSVAPVVHDLDDAASTRTSLESERNELADREAAAKKELIDKEAAAEHLVAEKTAATELLQREITALEGQLADRDTQLEESRREIEQLRDAVARSRQSLEIESTNATALEARLGRERKRSRDLARTARHWRHTYVAEHGESDARIELVARAAELQRSLASAEHRLAIAEEQRTRFVDELELRDRALAALSRERVSPQPTADNEQRVFTWPSEGEPIEVSGEIDRSDGAGIAGHVNVMNRSDIVPVVEIRIDGLLAAAQTCLAVQGQRGASPQNRWRFFFPWDRLGPEYAGRQAVVLVAGVEHELGRTAVPAELRTYHLSPAARAASELGGTVAEAAEYHRWLLEREGPHDADLARAYRADKQMVWPTIRIIVYGRDDGQLQLTLQSLQGQAYADWQALCVDAPKKTAELDPRVRVIAAGRLEEAIAEQGEDALFAFVEAGDLLGETAILHLAEAARTNPGFALIYSDEDLVEPNSRLRAVPHMKGAWSPDLALSRDYVCRLALVRGDKLGVKSPVDSASIYEIALRAALSGTGPVVHVPFVLYHRAARNASKSQPLAKVVQSVIDSTPAMRGAVATAAEGQTRVRWPMPEPEPRVSLIVPTRDGVDLLRACVDGFLHETRYKDLEVLIADNDSQEEETKVYLAKVSTHPRVRVIPCPGPFNFSKINNLAAQHAKGALIGLMNNDLKVFEPEWLREMVSHAVRPDVGIVGAKLLYEDGTIQHAGVTLGIALASHLYKFSPGGGEGHQGRLNITQDVSAVTAACLLMRREVWDEVGGLDEAFPVAYNDVDLCLRVRTAGYRILWTPDAQLYHLESRTRGRDAAPEKRERLNQDKERLIERWGDALLADPFHSPNFSATHTDSRLSFPPRAMAPWQPAVATQ
jgi:GT2 family glycosyltransferase